MNCRLYRRAQTQFGTAESGSELERAADESGRFRELLAVKTCPERSRRAAQEYPQLALSEPNRREKTARTGSRRLLSDIANFRRVSSFEQTRLVPYE